MGPDSRHRRLRGLARSRLSRPLPPGAEKRPGRVSPASPQGLRAGAGDSFPSPACCRDAGCGGVPRGAVGTAATPFPDEQPLLLTPRLVLVTLRPSPATRGVRSSNSGVGCVCDDVTRAAGRGLGLRGQIQGGPQNRGG